MQLGTIWHLGVRHVHQVQSMRIVAMRKLVPPSGSTQTV